MESGSVALAQLSWGLRLTGSPNATHRRLLAEHGDRLDLVILQADSVASLGSQPFARLPNLTPGARYLIDPRTAPFGLGRKALLKEKGDRDPAPGFARLVATYGESFERLARVEEPATITPDFAGSHVRDQVVRVLAFQRWMLSELSVDARHHGPRGWPAVPAALLIPPYFRIPRGQAAEGWLELNLSLWHHAADELQPGEALLPVLLVTRSVLPRESLARTVAAAVNDIGAPGLGLWVDNLTETKDSVQALRNLRLLVRGLSDAGVSVIALYSGFFSGLLSYIGLYGWCHRITTDSGQTLMPGGGSRNRTATYYVPQVHRAIDVTTVAAFIRDRWGSDEGVLNLCRCAVCQRAADAGFLRVYGFGTKGPVRGEPSATANALAHRLAVRRREFEALARQSYPEARGELAIALNHFPGSMSDHLARWLRALNDP